MDSLTRSMFLALAVLLPLVSESKADCELLPSQTGSKIFCTSLTSLPSKYPDVNATHLEFSTRNVIQNITSASFSTLRNLKSLKLSRVAVENIAADAFEGLDELETLSLGENIINEIKPGTFAGLTKLRVLRLESNSLSFLPTDALPDSLESLELDYNEFKEIPLDALRGKTRLNTLKMNNNHISSLPDLTNIKTLKNLEVTDNRLQTVNPNIFKGLQLKEVLLNSNPFICDCSLTAFFQWIKTYQFGAVGSAFKPEFSEYECQGPKVLEGRFFNSFNLTAFKNMNCTIPAISAKASDEEGDVTPNGTASATMVSRFSVLLVFLSALWRMDEW